VDEKDAKKLLVRLWQNQNYKVVDCRKCIVACDIWTMEHKNGILKKANGKLNWSYVQNGKS